MKVLMLNGSGNANGSTRAGLDIMADVFATEGIETEIVCVGAKPVRDCLGCGKCAEKGKCVFQDDGVNDFVEKAATA
ncbi:MAG: flavodoxin family protein, partial [Victivallales bacterium]|nr:flavodoxin family protein [Victivallales bacterium]